jgi:uncharacterized protein (DUF1800 family)
VFRVEEGIVVADPADIAHLLRRTEFVARPNRVAALTPLTIEQAVDDVLNINTVAVPIPPDLAYHDENNGWPQYLSAIAHWMDRMVDIPKPFQEKMTLFWHGLLVTSWDKVSRAPLMLEQISLYRNSGLLGNFRTMLQTMSLQPAMLLYLDNVDNFVGEPNQNFARELLELFSLGVGNYTEDDVAAAAAAWTGHGVNWDTYQYQFRANRHDNSNKTFMGETKNWNGPDIIERVLRHGTPQKMIACRYLTKKLWEHFAYQNPEQTVIDQVAQVLHDNDFNIRPWVRAMLVHPSFYSTAAKQGMVMQPVDWLVNLMYRTGYRSAVLHPEWFLEGMGQALYRPPNVSGWRPNLYWVNSSVLGARAGAARSITWRLRERPDFDATLEIKSKSKAEAIDTHANFFGVQLTPTSRAAIDSYLTAQRAAEPWGGWWESVNLLTMTMLAPEGHMA